MNPTILGVIGPGFLNQAPTLYSLSAVSAPCTPGIGAHPLIKSLRQHIVPPQPPICSQ